MGNFMENLESAFPVKPGLDERRLRGWGHPLDRHCPTRLDRIVALPACATAPPAQDRLTLLLAGKVR
jgi:hypothetical protein